MTPFYKISSCDTEKKARSRKKDRGFFIMVCRVYLVCAAAAGGFYFLFGHRLIRAMYHGESLDFLNRIIVGQKVHSLAFYIHRADALFWRRLVWAAVLTLLGVAAISILRAYWRKWSGKYLLNLCVCVLSIAVSLGAAEIFLRVKGFKPARQSGKRVVVEPGGRLAVIHPVLGYSMLPGQFKAILPSGYSFVMTHLPNTLRITHPLGTYPPAVSKKEIWIFGCSFTYGWSLNDQDTYCWKLQEKLPDYEVVNSGVIGYGTLQSMIQCREALKAAKVKPAVVVYAYASFHDVRNTFLRRRRQAVGKNNELGPFRQPFARMSKQGDLIYSMTDVVYRDVPLARYLALMQLINERYNDLEERCIPSHEISKRIVLDFASMVKREGIEFVVAGIDTDSAGMLAWLTRQGIKTVDIAVDLSKQENRNWPYDSHPNARANAQYARQLGDFLKREILKGP